MKTLIPLLALLCLAACVAETAADLAPPRVDVVFVNPDKFSDVRDGDPGSDRGRDEYLKRIKEHIESQVNKYIPEGQHLALHITDVKLAGDFEPWRGPAFSDVRYIKDLYPPRINLEFRLTDANGKIIKQGGRKITDEDFMTEINLYFPDDTLRYEKQLLDNWLNDEFGLVRK